MADSKPQVKEEKPKATDDKKYAIFLKDSIKTMAESAGHERLSEETAAILAEDVCYRLREAVQVCVSTFSLLLNSSAQLSFSILILI